MPSESPNQMKKQWALMGTVIPITLLLGLDMIDDYRSGVSTEHLLIEVAFSTLGLIAAGLLLEGISRARLHAGSLEEHLTKAVSEAERLRAETKNASAQTESFERQFEKWQLSPAEREVATLLLKGLSYQHIAASRNASEGTVRQQALSVYRKAGMSGRSELAAYFLEDLLVACGRGNGSEYPASRPPGNA